MTYFEWHAPAFHRLIANKARLPHALLVRGPAGIGKLAFAQALAKALLCETPAENGDACGSCTACMWLDARVHPDYRQVEPQNEGDRDGEADRRSTAITVDQIRALPDFINISSHRGGPKIVVIHPAEMLNANAANALLKNLEEPPPRTCFILVAHRPHQLLATIKSRCQHLALRTPDATTGAAWLAEQGVRRPEVALAHTANAPLLAAELESAGYWGARSAFLRHLTADGLDVLAAAEALGDCAIADVIAWLQKWSYDLVHYRAIGTVRYNPDYAEAIAKLARGTDLIAATRFQREVVRLQRLAHHPLNARLFIEELLLAYRDLVQQHESAQM